MIRQAYEPKTFVPRAKPFSNLLRTLCEQRDAKKHAFSDRLIGTFTIQLNGFHHRFSADVKFLYGRPVRQKISSICTRGPKSSSPAQVGVRLVRR